MANDLRLTEWSRYKRGQPSVVSSARCTDAASSLWHTGRTNRKRPRRRARPTAFPVSSPRRNGCEQHVDGPPVHLSMHNWMRAEPLELTLNRLADSGYESIEIRGEPMRYDTKQVLSLLERYGLRCWGSVTMMTSGRDLVHEDPYVRLGTIQYMKDTVRMISELGGAGFCIVPSTVGKLEPMAPPEQEWAWAVEGLRQVYDVARSLDVRIGVEPLNRFETYFINRHDQALQLARTSAAIAESSSTLST